jgi:L-rhamnose mutarotase
MRRNRLVIGLPAENVQRYEELHAAVWPDVLARISASHIANYSIYRHGDLLFSYMEYVGDDFEATWPRWRPTRHPGGWASASRCSARSRTERRRVVRRSSRALPPRLMAERAAAGARPAAPFVPEAGDGRPSPRRW